MAGLSGKVALVTGGSRGIGAAIVGRLARDGADVALTYVSSADKAEAVAAEVRVTGRRSIAIEADSADPDAVAAAVERTVAELGRLDILVNNAGVASYGTLQELSLKEADRVWEVNVRSVIAASHAAVQHLGADGRIINIGSCVADRVKGPGQSLYAMSKSALIGLTKGWARDVGSRGITVNLIHVGPTNTDMNPADGERAAAQLGLLALGHYGATEDVAATVAHLAGPGGRFITGASISVDGGYAA